MTSLSSDSAGGVQQAYQDMLDRGRFRLQRCQACQAHVFFPRELCPHCGSRQLAWHDSAGHGTVHAVTTVRRKADAGGDYNLSLIDLDEGVRLMSRVQGSPPADVRIGLRVQAQVVQHNGQGLLLFRPAEPAAAQEGGA